MPDKNRIERFVDERLSVIDAVADDINADVDHASYGLAALKALIDTVDGVTDGIQSDLGNPTDGLGALKALIDTVDTVVDSILEDTGATIPGILGTPVISIAADIADLITREKGFNDIHDDVAAIQTSLDRTPVVTGTADSGSEGTLVDDALTQVDDFWNGSILLMRTGNNAGLARTIVDFEGASDTLYVEPGFPYAIAAGDEYTIVGAPSHAEILIGANNADNAADTSNVVANEDGSILERLEDLLTKIDGNASASNYTAARAALLDNLSQLDSGGIPADIDELKGGTSTGTHNVEVVHGTEEQVFATISPAKNGKMAVVFDLDTLEGASEGGTITVRLKQKVDGANFRTIDRATYIVGADEMHPIVEEVAFKGADTAQISIQCSSAVTTQRAIPYRVIEYS